jgi:hypothetical protein
MKSLVFNRRLSAGLVLPLGGVNWGAIVTGIGLFGLFVVLFSIIQFATPNLVGNDGYFHIKFSQIMRQQGLRPPFPWLPMTILNPEAFYDHHFLYHVLMIPFTYGDLREGAKWVSIIFPALTFVTGWFFLWGQRVPYAALWSLGFFAVSEAFLYRMSMPRVQSVSLLMLLLMLHITLTRRYRWLLPLAFIYIWLYDAFLLVLILVGAYVAMRWLLDQQLDLAPLVYTTLGLGLGLLLNPYFPNNLLFIYHHLLPKLTDTTGTGVGSEWLPYRTWTLVENSGVALLAFVAGVFALGLRERRMDSRTATLLLITIVFALILFKSRRFVEYYPAFALLFCAVAWSSFFKGWSQSKTWIATALPLGLTLVLSAAIWFNIQATQEELQQNSKAWQRYDDAAAWLEANTPLRSQVFQTDWDDFTRLFFYNTHNTYTLGLDPTYMQVYDADLYDLWRGISKGWVKTPGRTIAETFGAGYVLTDLDHESFLDEAEADPDLEEVYRDEDAAIFLVLSQADKMARDY